MSQAMPPQTLKPFDPLLKFRVEQRENCPPFEVRLRRTRLTIVLKRKRVGMMRERRSRRIASPLLAASLAIVLAAVPCASFSPATSLMGNLKGLSVAHSSATRTSGRARGARRWRKGHGAAPGGEIRPSTADTTPARWGICQWFAGRCHPCLSNQQEGKGDKILIPSVLALVPFAGVCVSMGLFGWGDRKKDGDKEEPRDGEERLRWQSAITQACP